MLQSTPTREATATWVGAIYEDKQRRRLLIAIILLLAAITAVLVRDYEAGLNNIDEAAAADSRQVAFAPETAGPPPAIPATEATPPVVATQSGETARRHTRSRVAPGKAHLAAKSVNGESPRGVELAAARRSAALHPSTRQPSPSYPLLTQATAVQGSVLLQAMIAADGTVEEMLVISGPAILVSAARQAVQEWRFKPYLLNGKAVETYARVTVNFSIDVSNTEARYHVSSVTSAGAL